MIDIEIGAFPFVIRRGKPLLMIITNRSGKAWILPKGQPEQGLSYAQVALLEASEEAGVEGKLVAPLRHKDFKRRGGGFLRIYPLAVRKVLRKWPEQSFRKRELVSVKQALERVTHKEHVEAINYFTRPEKLKQLARSVKS
jgi:8-oxo-dGTP pyrophosphatase MutT (NUDIX family)